MSSSRSPSSSPSVSPSPSPSPMYGLKIWDEDGIVKIDTTAKLTRLVYEVFVPKDESGSIILPDISGEQVGIVSNPITIYVNDMSHFVYRNGTTINWVAVSTSFSINCASQIFIFIVVE